MWKNLSVCRIIEVLNDDKDKWVWLLTTSSPLAMEVSTVRAGR
jgi:hypothetical protein